MIKILRGARQPERRLEDDHLLKGNSANFTHQSPCTNLTEYCMHESSIRAFGVPQGAVQILINWCHLRQLFGGGLKAASLKIWKNMRVEVERREFTRPLWAAPHLCLRLVVRSYVRQCERSTLGFSKKKFCQLFASREEEVPRRKADRSKKKCAISGSAALILILFFKLSLTNLKM